MRKPLLNQRKIINMKISKQLALCGMLAFGGYSATIVADDAPKFSGFLKDYSGFEKSPKVSGAWRYIKPGAEISDLKLYNKLKLDPIQVWIHPDAEFKGVDPNQLQGMTDYFRSSIVKAMEPDYPVVDSSGAGVLRMSVAITGVVPQQPKRSAIGYLPIALAFSAAKGAADAIGGKEVVQLEASVEAAFYSSDSDELLFAFVDSRRGEKKTVDQESTDLGWESTKPALDFWAAELRKRFDESHGKLSSESPFNDF